MESFCRSFCKSFSYDTPVFDLDENGNGTATAVCKSQDLPVFNSSITFTVHHGDLLTVSGTLLPQEGSSVSTEVTPLSASAALTTFQNARRESGAVVSAILELNLCYELQSSSALTLIPSWCITTDTVNYYVNCISGSVTSAK